MPDVPPLAFVMIGPEPGNATLTSNTESAVPPPLVNLYCFTSPNPYVSIALIVPYVAPDVLFFFNTSPDANVPLVLYRKVVVPDDTAATRNPVAPLVAPTTKSPALPLVDPVVIFV